MSEESLPPESQQENPRPKKVAKAAKTTKTAKSSGKTEPAASTAKVPAAKAGKSRKEEATEKQAAPSDGPAAGAEDRPAIKRGVRGTKKTAKKGASKEGSKEPRSDKHGSSPEPKDPNPSPTSSAGEAANEPSSRDDAPHKQARRGRNRNRQDRQEPQHQDGPKTKLDAKLVAKRAWKIFLGEVGEEGLALIADKDARELARRSLRVAEIYSLEEEVSLQKKGPSKNER